MHGLGPGPVPAPQETWKQVATPRGQQQLKALGAVAQVSQDALGKGEDLSPGSSAAAPGRGRQWRPALDTEFAPHVEADSFLTERSQHRLAGCRGPSLRDPAPWTPHSGWSSPRSEPPCLPREWQGFQISRLREAPGAESPGHRREGSVSSPAPSLLGRSVPLAWVQVLVAPGRNRQNPGQEAGLAQVASTEERPATGWRSCTWFKGWAHLGSVLGS